MITSIECHRDSSSQIRSDATPVVRVIDDDVSVRESLELLIRSAGWQTEVFSCATEFLASPCVPGPACLVLDVSLPDINGLDLQQCLVHRGDNVPIVMVSGWGDVHKTVRAMKAGAIDFVTKPIDCDALLAAIAHGIERSRAELQKEAEIRVLQERHASLSHREREVMERVVVGRLNKQIAYELHISEITVKAHRGRMMQKMQARSVPDLVRMAAQLCLAT
jgi:FixJ family two-component response regulator